MKTFLALILLAVILSPAFSAESGDCTFVPRDVRLDRLVTCEPGYRRLHEVVSDLSRQTGVDIRCGVNDKDWRVKDIPVMVCCHDLPLRDLLGRIADSSHLLLSLDPPRTDAEVKKPIYRLWRDGKRTREINSYPERKRVTREKLALWSWDAVMAISELPDSAFIKEKKEAKDPDWISFQMMREWGKVLKAHSPDVKKELFSDGRIKFWLEDGEVTGSTPRALAVRYTAALRALEPEYYRYWGEEGITKTPMHAATSENFRHVKVKINGRMGETANIDFEVRLSGLNLHFNFLDEATRLANYVNPSAIPPRPPADQMDHPISEFVNQDLKVIRSDTDWDHPLLNTKATLKLPPEIKQPSYSDVLFALSKASGVSLVCEDFESHKPQHAPDVPVDKETTVGEVLRKFDDRFTWLVDEKRRMIVGWAKIWPERHTNLIPESLLVQFESKLNGDGLYIDDVTPLAHFSGDAFFEWIYQHPKLNVMRACIFGDPKAWAFYDTLSPRNKKLAWSDAGMPFTRFRPEKIAEIFRIGEIDIIPNLSLKVRTGSAIQISCDVYRIHTLKDGTTVPPHWLPEKLREQIKQNIYHMEITGKKADGSDFGWRDGDGPGQPLPIFSPERETELGEGNSSPQRSQRTQR